MPTKIKLTENTSISDYLKCCNVHNIYKYLPQDNPGAKKKVYGSLTNKSTTTSTISLRLIATDELFKFNCTPCQMRAHKSSLERMTALGLISCFKVQFSNVRSIPLTTLDTQSTIHTELTQHTEEELNEISHPLLQLPDLPYILDQPSPRIISDPPPLPDIPHPPLLITSFQNMLFPPLPDIPAGEIHMDRLYTVDDLLSDHIFLHFIDKELLEQVKALDIHASTFILNKLFESFELVPTDSTYISDELKSKLLEKLEYYQDNPQDLNSCLEVFQEESIVYAYFIINEEFKLVIKSLPEITPLMIQQHGINALSWIVVFNKVIFTKHSLQEQYNNPNTYVQCKECKCHYTTRLSYMRLLDSIARKEKKQGVCIYCLFPNKVIKGKCTDSNPNRYIPVAHIEAVYGQLKVDYCTEVIRHTCIPELEL